MHPYAMMQSPQTSSQGADAMAKRMGFPDAATAAAYYQKRQQIMGGPGPSVAAPPGSPQGVPQQGGLLDHILSIHPSVLLGHVLSAWNQATGSQ